MLINWTTCIHGEKVILVPYKRSHVEKYHQWMTSEELQKMTGSEPLSLEEEYEMQASWREDQDKCTFIILSKESWEREQDEISAMAGDTNLFLSDEDTAEAEIMVAETGMRRKGLGWEAMLLMLRYGLEKLNVKKFEAKIKIDNAPSIRMFEKIGFKETSRSEVFEEMTLCCNVDSNFSEWLQGNTQWELKKYDHD